MAIPITQKAKSPCKYDIIEGEQQTLNYGGDNVAQLIDKSIKKDEKKEDSVQAPPEQKGSEGSNGSGGKNVFTDMMNKFNKKKSTGDYKIDLPDFNFSDIKL